MQDRQSLHALPILSWYVTDFLATVFLAVAWVIAVENQYVFVEVSRFDMLYSDIDRINILSPATTLYPKAYQSRLESSKSWYNVVIDQ